MPDVLPEPLSPCQHHCGFKNGCCRHCYRTTEEVSQWRTLSPAQKTRVMELATARRLQAEALPG